MSFQFKTTFKEPGSYVIACDGRLDTETSPQLEKEVKWLLQKAPQLLALDLKGVNYMSSAGVRILIMAQKGVKPHGGKLALLNIQPPVKKVLEIINALPNQKIFKDMEELDRYLDAIQRKVREGD